MEYLSEYMHAYDLLAEGHLVDCVIKCGSIFEIGLKEIVHRMQKDCGYQQLEAFRTEELKIGKGEKQFQQFTLGQVVGVYREAKLFQILRKKLRSPLNKTLTIDLDQLAEWRNIAVHNPESSSIGKLDAQMMLTWTASLLEECCLVDDPEALPCIEDKAKEEPSGTCASCEAVIMPTWHYCPMCGYSMRQICPYCSRPIENPAWKVCPFCEEKLVSECNKDEVMNRHEYKLICRGIWSDHIKNSREAEFLLRKRREAGISFQEARDLEKEEAPSGALEYELTLWADIKLLKKVPDTEWLAVRRQQAYEYGIGKQEVEAIEKCVIEQYLMQDDRRDGKASVGQGGVAIVEDTPLP